MKIQQILEAKKGVKAPKYAVKPRNFVAKNAITTTSGAGAHKDKKKADKQGEVKHKGKELAENDRAQDAFKELEANVENPNNSMSDLDQMADKFRKNLPPSKPTKLSNLPDVDQYEHAKRFGKFDGSYGDWLKNKKVQENKEYDDEAGMADNNLSTLERAVEGIDDLINAGDNLPEWCQEKIAVAKSMLVTVWDYMKSEENSEQDVGEGLGYSQDPEQAKWYHEGRKAFKFGTTGNTIQDVARKHNCPSEWIEAFHAGYQDQEGWGKDDVNEASRNPDTMSATDYDRYQQSQMDSEKRNFKRDEMEQELGDEDRGMYFVVIAKNGKWEHTKAQPRQEGMNAAQSIITSLHNKYPSMHLGMQGPDGKVYNYGRGK
jgi:hypothetical protein